MDQFPQTQENPFDSLTTFCFPHGLSIRIIPKCAIEGARRLGWVGRKADRYQLHAFHDISGKPNYGVSITVREEMNLPSELFSEIKTLRLQRKVVTKIINTWRKHKLKASTCQEILNPNSIKRLVNTSINKWRLNKPDTDIKEIESKTDSSNEQNTLKTFQLTQVKSRAKKLAAETYKTMTENFDVGDTCIVEQCYILLGIKPENNTLILTALQKLIDFEDQPKKDILLHGLSSSKKFLSKRHDILEEFQSKLCPPPSKDIMYCSDLEYMSKERKRYEVLDMDLKLSFPNIFYSLPLPQVSSQWGIAQLILRFK